MSLFSEVNLPSEQLKNLESLGYLQMTDIQRESLPLILNKQDIIGQAKTGSGKTAAFGIPLIEVLTPKFFGIQGLVLCPTRELATQVADELRKLARYQDNIKILTLCGGMPLGPQLGSLEKGAHIVVGTPGRISDLIEKEKLDLSNVRMAVLDEADRMLDMGFFETVDAILGKTPATRQTLMFSATFNDNIKRLSQELQKNPTFVKVDEEPKPNKVQNIFVNRGDEGRFEVLHRLIGKYKPEQAIVFCNTKQDCDNCVQFLDDAKISARALHGDMEQKDRDLTLTLFANGSCNFLVATDVAARGLDIDSLPFVINLDLPRQSDVFVHRIGRTARADKAGTALSIYTEKESYKIEKIQELLPEPIVYKEIPSITGHFTHFAKMRTICVAGGKKHKLRPGDLLGTLIQGAGIAKEKIGKIKIYPMVSYIAVEEDIANEAVGKLSRLKIKNRQFKVRLEY